MIARSLHKTLRIPIDKIPQYASICRLPIEITYMLKRTVLAGLGLVLLASPLLASADSLSGLQAEMKALMAQLQTLQTLQAQLNQQTTPTATPAVFSPV